jgi:hypothetical protein
MARRHEQSLCCPPRHTDWPFPFSQDDWAQPPPAVQAYLVALHPELTQLQPRVEVLEARTQASSQTASRPPSSDSPLRQGHHKRKRKLSGRPGAQPGHRGIRQALLSPTPTAPLVPTAYACGSTTLTPATPYYTHPVIALPPLAMDSTHGVL